MEDSGKRNRQVLVLILSLLFFFPLFNGYGMLTREGGMHSSYYFVGYETGFGARKLLGTVFSWILPEYTTHNDLIPYIFAVLLAIAILFVNYCYRTFKNDNLATSRNARPFFLTLAIYLASSYSILKAMSLVWLADIWLYLLTLVFVTLFAKHRSHGGWPLVYAVIVLTACLIHHIFCCLFLPLFVTLFVYEIFESNHAPHRRLLVYGGICLSVVALMAYLWLFSEMNMGVEELSQRLEQRADNVCNKDVFYLNLLYGSSHSNYLAMWDVGQFPARYIQFPFLVLLLSPLIWLFIWPWILCVRHAKQRKERWKYALIPCVSIVMFLPIFVVATDYGRWWMAWFFCQMLLLLTMYRLGDRPIIAAMRTILSWCRRHWVLSVLLVVYVLQLRIANADNAGVDVLSWAQILYRSLF